MEKWTPKIRSPFFNDFYAKITDIKAKFSSFKCGKSRRMFNNAPLCHRKRILRIRALLRVFFRARSPSKLVYIGAEGAFRKILGSVGQKWISEKISKGGPFGSAGG